jgi:hypothetical protein
MSQYDNTDRGVLFKNDRKESDNHPDYKGSINVGGQEFWLSAWIKDGAKGKFMSLSVKPKEDQQRQGTPQRQAPTRQAPSRSQSAAPDMDDVPFSNPLAGRQWLAQ